MNVSSVGSSVRSWRMEWDEEEVEIDLGNERVREGVCGFADLCSINMPRVRGRVGTKEKE